MRSTSLGALASFDQALSALKAGKPIVLLDDAARENEGDIVFPAQFVTPDKINFMLRYCSGIICVCLPPAYTKRLRLPLMIPEEENTSRYQTAFTVSVEAKEGITTGVSAMDRAKTIEAIVRDDATPEDLVRPGHIFPIRAVQGGVLERRGHTEGSVDLMRLAGLKPLAVICEVMNADGSMARMPAMRQFAKQHVLPMVLIEQVVDAMQTSSGLLH